MAEGAPGAPAARRCRRIERLREGPQTPRGADHAWTCQNDRRGDGHGTWTAAVDASSVVGSSW